MATTTTKRTRPRARRPAMAPSPEQVQAQRAAERATLQAQLEELAVDAADGTAGAAERLQAVEAALAALDQEERRAAAEAVGRTRRAQEEAAREARRRDRELAEQDEATWRELRGQAGAFEQQTAALVQTGREIRATSRRWYGLAQQRFPGAPGNRRRYLGVEIAEFVLTELEKILGPDVWGLPRPRAAARARGVSLVTRVERLGGGPAGAPAPEATPDTEEVPA